MSDNNNFIGYIFNNYVFSCSHMNEWMNLYSCSCFICTFFLSPAALNARDGRYWNAHRLSVCLSFSFSFCTGTQKCISVFYRNFAGMCTNVMGVCCVVFDIDWMLFEFYEFLKYGKTNAGGGANFSFLEKQFFLISFCVLCYFLHLKKMLFVKYWKVPLHMFTYSLTG